MQGQRLHGAPLHWVQGVTGDVTLLLHQDVHISTQPDDITFCLLVSLWLNEEQPTEHRCQWQVHPCRRSFASSIACTIQMNSGKTCMNAVADLSWRHGIFASLLHASASNTAARD